MKKKAKVANHEMRELTNVSVLTTTTFAPEESSIIQDTGIATENVELLVTSESIIDDCLSVIEISESRLEGMDTTIQTV